MTKKEKQIANFVENYNKCMDWNRDILDKFNFDIKYAKDFVKNYLTTDKIDKDSYDLEHAEVYTYGDLGMLELQAYSYKTLGTSYFWIFPDYTEQSYKEKKLNAINESLIEHLSKLTEKINELTLEKDEFLKIKDSVKHYDY